MSVFSIRDLPDAALAGLVRCAPDEAIAVLLCAVAAELTPPAPAATEPKVSSTKEATPPAASTEAPPPAPMAEAPMPGPVASKRGDGSAYADRVHRFLIGVDAASRLDIVQATGLDENQVSYALRILRGQERAFSAGKTNRTRYAVTQEAADAASRAA